MPILSASDYRPHPLLRHSHSNTILSALIRKVSDTTYQRERIDTPDGDFLDLDWSRTGGDHLLIVCHGLEGNAGRPYVRGLIRAANDQGWDGLGLNFRGCSGEDNNQLRTYHMGETGDLHLVVNHALRQKNYKSVHLAGFSLGGNVVMMYLSRDADQVPDRVRSGVAYSVPCDIPSANQEIVRWQNFVYVYRFMRTLNQKMQEKVRQYPEQFAEPLPRSSSFMTFDDYFTAPVHGFEDARDYWESSSCRPYLPMLQRPAMMINALDDSFLSPECYPREEAAATDHFHLAIPKWGGHVGFLDFGRRHLWSEVKGMEFMTKHASRPFI